MGRLDHLKLSLPRMLEQPAEVIVVDYSCPQSTADYVEAHFPAARIAREQGKQHFSNWQARNSGAAVAQSDVLVFCDADTILAKGAIDWLSNNFPTSNFGHFDRVTTAGFNKSGLRLASNQLRGFQVIPRHDFHLLGGYDEVLQGYAAGGDTDLEDRLVLLGLTRCALDPNIIDDVLEHDNADRTKHHADPISTSYAAGLLYRTAKLALLRMGKSVDLPVQTRRNVYNAARKAAKALGPSQSSASLSVTLDVRPVLMPRQLGYEQGLQKLSLKVDVQLRNRITEIPD
jgi:glycosyltransferase involved in cell wall biosynthesis